MTVRRCAALLAAMLQLILAPTARVEFAMKTGILLRMHVVAQDDTPAMQQVKFAVRDAVCAAYAERAEDGRTMLMNTQQHLPALAAAAEEAARAAGFTGTVAVTLEQRDFDARTLDGVDVPAGRYPALMIRLGDARGRNCWGLIDPSLALRCAMAGEAEDIEWDWSLTALWEALAGLFRKEAL